MRVIKLTILRLFIILILFIFIVQVNADYSDCSVYGNCKTITSTTSSVNYSLVNVNNSDLLDNIDSTGFCRLNFSNKGRIESLSIISSTNGTYWINISRGTSVSGTGAIIWSGGSKLFEQDGSLKRMIYTPNGDRFEVLNEVGNQFIFTVAGTSASFGTRLVSYETLIISNRSDYSTLSTGIPFPRQSLVVQNNLYVGINNTGDGSLAFINGLMTVNGTLNITNGNYSINGIQGITKEIQIVEDVDLLGMTKTYCNQTIIGGIITNTSCGNSEIVNLSFIESTCTGTNKMTGINSSGRAVCGEDLTGASSGATRTFKELTMNISILNMTYKTIDSLTFNTQSNTNYTFTCNIYFNSINATTGIGLNVTTNYSQYDIIYNIKIPTSATAWTMGSYNAKGTQLLATAGIGTAIEMATIDGRIINNGNYGSVTINARNEVNNAWVSVLKRSNCIWYNE